MMIELSAGETVGGKYRVERLLGRGAVGTVYGAEHLETGKRVALKCVDTSFAIDPAVAERLVREAQAAARIRHTNVVDIYDVGRDDKLMFLVMEYLEGEPLSALLARKELPLHRLIAQLLPAMRGVAEAHRQGVIHRDIKPENIFFAKQIDVGEPVAKVLDFGISKLDARGQALRALTADGFAIGTPGYMAYEQAMGDRSIDGRADVYAFGAILYEAATGRVPHSAKDFSALVRHFLTQRVPTPLELGASVPDTLSALVMWAIERDREQRVSNMEALIRELEPFAAEPRAPVSAAPRPAGGRTVAGPWGLVRPPQQEVSEIVPRQPVASSLPETTIDEVAWLKRSRKRHQRGLWVLLAVSLVALGLIGFSLWPSAQSPQPPAARRAPTQHSVSAASALPRVPQVPIKPRNEVAGPELPHGLSAPAGTGSGLASPPAAEPPKLEETPRLSAQTAASVPTSKAVPPPPKVEPAPAPPPPPPAAQPAKKLIQPSPPKAAVPPPAPAAAPKSSPSATPVRPRKNYGIY